MCPKAFRRPRARRFPTLTILPAADPPTSCVSGLHDGSGAEYANHRVGGICLCGQGRARREPPRLPAGLDDAGGGLAWSRAATAPFRGATIAPPNGGCHSSDSWCALDGSNGNMRIIDSGGGTPPPVSPDSLRQWGPMQFIPETWRLYGVDANNDGIVSPDNVDDAALSAAGYLCNRGGDLATPKGGWMKALRAYNQSDPYARSVRDWATAYAAGHSL